MNVDINNPDHVVTMISGFEAISLRDYQNSDAQYVNSVLKMNGCDLSTIAGQEGFLSAIKAGGAKLIEMIWNFLKKIKEFFFGAAGGKSDKAVDTAVNVGKEAAKTISNTPDLGAEIIKNEASLISPLRTVEKTVSKKQGIDIGLGKMIKDLTESAAVIREATSEYQGQNRNRLIPMNNMLTGDFTSGLSDLNKLQLNIIIDEGIVDGKTLIQTTTRANDVSNALRKLREGSKKYLAEATPVLDELTQAHDKALKAKVKGGDSEFIKILREGDKENAMAYEPAIRAIARSIAIAVKLIQQCNNYIAETTKALVRIAGLVSGKETKDLTEFTEFMDSNASLQL